MTKTGIAYNQPFTNIRAAAQVVSKERPYHPLYSTAQGCCNVFSGASQCIVGLCMKCSSDSYYHTTQSEHHLTRGWRIMKQGVGEIFPVAAGAIALATTYHLIS